MTENSPEGNPAVIAKIPNLMEKYGTDKYLLDKYSGHLYVANKHGVYTCIEEKGWIYPTESSLMEPIVGSSQDQDNKTPQSIQLSNFKKTPEAESTRDPLMASPKFSKEMIAGAINQELLDSISLMMRVKERKDAKEAAISEALQNGNSKTLPLHDPETAEGENNEKATLGEAQRTSSLDLHLKMIEEQNQLEELAREKTLRAE